MSFDQSRACSMTWRTSKISGRSNYPTRTYEVIRVSYWNEFALGLELAAGTEYSESIRQFAPGTTFDCPGSFGVPAAHDIPKAVFSGSWGESSTYAADHISLLAAYDLVEVFVTGGGPTGGMQGGWYDCDDYHHHGFRSGGFAGVSLSGGPSSEVRSAADGTLLPYLYPFSPTAAPVWAGLFMRPTALTWAGQDPNNDANRAFWEPSEVIGAIGAISAATSMFDIQGYDFNFGSGVRAWNVVGGSGGSGTGPLILFI